MAKSNTKWYLAVPAEKGQRFTGADKIEKIGGKRFKLTQITARQASFLVGRAR